ncbi:MAG: hypothetical protein II304_10085 [Bacteroidales bacterium]|nr:hypothetical protein [Bacteroidales bacterium]
MKVITDRYSYFPKEVECDGCDSTILLESFDDVKQIEEQTPFDRHIQYKWVCPCCKKINYLERKLY